MRTFRPSFFQGLLLHGLQGDDFFSYGPCFQGLLLHGFGIGQTSVTLGGPGGPAAPKTIPAGGAAGADGAGPMGWSWGAAGAAPQKSAIAGHRPAAMAILKRSRSRPNQNLPRTPGVRPGNTTITCGMLQHFSFRLCTCNCRCNATVGLTL